VIEIRLERGYVSLTVAASLLGITRQRMHQLLKAGRINGAFLMDCGDGRERWVVPRSELNPYRVKQERDQRSLRWLKERIVATEGEAQ
jgi:hypothetical protein